MNAWVLTTGVFLCVTGAIKLLHLVFTSKDSEGTKAASLGIILFQFLLAYKLFAL